MEQWSLFVQDKEKVYKISFSKMNGLYVDSVRGLSVDIETPGLLLLTQRDPNYGYYISHIAIRYGSKKREYMLVCLSDCEVDQFCVSATHMHTYPTIYSSLTPIQS